MTLETGSNRHLGARAAEGKSIRAFVATDDQIREVFTSYRTLDPVRAAALTAAVNAYSWHKPDYDTAQVLDLARTFEQYLTGDKEANGTT